MTRLFPFLLALLLLLLLVASSITAKEIPGFWSLNCGGEGFEAGNNITWVSDRDLIRTGVIRKGNNGRLRVFTSKETKKNCYTIPVGKGVKILVRLTFDYGDYDGLESPPEMELIFDGYDSGPFQTTMKSGGDRMEVIYVTKRNNTNICFGRTSSDQDPFAYYIAVRTLDLNTYNYVDESKVLIQWTRDAFGADDVIQYPDDRYDRQWNPRTDGFTVLRSDTNYTNTTNWLTDDDDPPQLLTRTAVGPLNGSSTNLLITLPDLPTYSVSIYYNIYFSEMSENTTHGSRAFNLLVDGIQPFSDTIIPPYQSFQQYHDATGIDASNSTTFEFVGTRNATLPPTINALEIYQIDDFSNGTFENDVVALEILQEHFKILQEWTGDPCLPENYNWEWIVCQLFDSTPRVRKLNLSGFGLSGPLPNFGDLDQLVTIDLHNNTLSGSVPEFLNHFKHLTVLNLANNKFTSIPTSLLNNKKIKLDISGNPIHFPSPPPGNVNNGQKAKVSELLLYLITLLLLLLIPS